MKCSQSETIALEKPASILLNQLILMESSQKYFFTLTNKKRRNLYHNAGSRNLMIFQEFSLLKCNNNFIFLVFNYCILQQSQTKSIQFRYAARKKIKCRIEEKTWQAKIYWSLNSKKVSLILHRLLNSRILITPLNGPNT